MALRAVIMAGGAGERLRPLTCGMPKPLAPLCGEPVMGYALRLLRRHDIHEAAATLWYMPEAITSAFGAGAHGVRLRYCTEDTPLGTAGSVKRALRESMRPGDTALVLSGDGLTGCDITAALRFHRQRGALATLALKRVEVPLAFGVVVTQADGRIARFIEKPDWSRVESDLVNTGLYLLEREALDMIPEAGAFDFGRELFPLLLARGLPLYGYETDAYWCDVGDPEAFLRAQGDILAGRAGFDAPCRGKTGAGISPDSYVSREAFVARGAVIARSCVLPGARVEAGARLNGAIVCENARVARMARLEDGAVLGAGAAAGERARLLPGARLWPGVTLPEDAVTDACVRQGAAVPRCAQDNAGAESPAQYAYLAGAFLKATRAKRVLVMRDGASQALYHTLLGALAFYGAREARAMGCGTRPMLAHACATLGAEGGLYAHAGGVWLCGAQGLPLSGAAACAVDQYARRRETSVSEADAPGGVIRACTGAREGYLRALAALFPAQKGLRVCVLCRDRALRALARDALRLAGHAPEQQAALTLRLTETDARPLLGEAGVSGAQSDWLCLRALKARQGAAYDCAELGALAGEGLLKCDESAACLAQTRLMRDGVARALMLLWYFEREGAREALLSAPRVFRAERSVPCDARDMARAQRLLRAGAEEARGEGAARVQADAVLPLFRVTALACSMEAADELCALSEARILRALKNGK